MNIRKCDECGEPFGEDDNFHGCDFCDKILCDDRVLYWSDEEIGDSGQCCSGCTEEGETE